MKIAVLSTFCLLGGALAAAPSTILRRDSSRVKEAISRVQASVVTLNAHLAQKPRSKDPNESREFIDRALQLQSENTGTLSYANGYVREGPSLKSSEFTALASSLMAMYSSTNTAVNAWVAAKPYAVSANRTTDVLRALREVQNEAFGFTDAVLSKSSGVTKAVAEWLTGGLGGSINTAIKKYSPQSTRGRN